MSADRRALHRDTFLSALKASPQLMGILNVTPDSFSDGGRHFDPAAAIARARAMVAEGAAIVDIGGESTRPGHLPVSEEEELRRVTPVLEALAGFDAPVSIDTAKAAVAREAARLGACVINDIWGLQRDPGMADAVAETGSAVVIMHNRNEADPAIDILDDVERFFERSLNLAAAAGAPFSRILLDPGVGFGKTPQQNHSCIWNLDRFRRLGPPILVGLSRKSFIGRITGAEVDRRLPATLAADTIALMRGASVLRVHDVAENREALAVFAALKRAAAPRPGPQARDDGRARVILALGGNVGDKVLSLRRALGALAGEPGIDLIAVSRFYRTPPWGKTDQDWFRQRLRARAHESCAGGFARPRQAARGRTRTQARGALGAARDRHRPHRLWRRDAQNRTADAPPSRTVQPGLRAGPPGRNRARPRDRGGKGRRSGGKTKATPRRSCRSID